MWALLPAAAVAAAATVGLGIHAATADRCSTLASPATACVIPGVVRPDEARCRAEGCCWVTHTATPNPIDIHGLRNAKDGARQPPHAQCLVPRSVRVEPINRTVYRITPHGITGVTDLNTGDAAGDAFFAIYEYMFPLYCQQMPTDSSCTARGALNVPNNNLYERSVVEVDPRFGAYAGCVPPESQPSSHHFVCRPYVNTSLCWWAQRNPDGRNFTDLAAVCDRQQCNCAAVDDGAVGAMYRPMGQASARWHNQTAMWRQIEELSNTLDGIWFSTRAAGQCREGQRLGSGECWWRFHGVNRRINATCLNYRLQNAIVAHNPGCWGKLPPALARNASSIPWIRCMLASLTGTAFEGAAPAPSGPMGRARILAAFDGSFGPESSGGCKELPAAAGPAQSAWGEQRWAGAGLWTYV